MKTKLDKIDQFVENLDKNLISNEEQGILLVGGSDSDQEQEQSNADCSNFICNNDSNSGKCDNTFVCY